MASQEGEFGMRIGKNYQAEIPDLVQDLLSITSLTRPGASLVWSPNQQRLDAKVDFYLEHATTKYSYTQEQALGMLLWHHHDVDVAISDLHNYAPTPDDWTTEDKIIFEQALARFGKNFNKIHSMMPDKSIGALVKYYYSWKKTKKPSGPLSKIHPNHQDDSKVQQDGNFQDAQRGMQKKRTECWMSFRPRVRNRVPYDLQLDAKELKMIAHGYGEHMIRHLESELINCKGKVASNKDIIGVMRNDLSEGIEQYRQSEAPCDVSPKWTNTELLLAVQGLRYYGKDFQSVSEMLGTKSEHLVRNFYLNYKARYGLDFENIKENKSKVNNNDCKVNQPEVIKQPPMMQLAKTFHGQKNIMQQPQTFYNKDSVHSTDKQ